MAVSTLVRPIILGGDIGAYATARTFHERFGVRSVVLAGVETWPVRRSVAVDHRIEPALADPDVLVRAVRAVAAEQPGRPHLVLGSADWLVEAVVKRRADLDEVIVPYAEAAALAAVTDKGRFTALCQELDIPVPRTAVLRATDGPGAAGHLTYPLVVKAASTADYHAVDFPGKRKVDHVADATELASVLARIAAAGYPGDLLVQEFVPGGDAEMAAVNLFFGAAGDFRFAQFGRVLLEEHTPGALGNSVAQVTGTNQTVVSQARALLERIGWRGFANVDVKRDPRDGTYRFLELNPRVGRSGYAVTASGYDVSQMYVDAFVTERAVEPVVGTAEHLFHVVPLALVRRYVSADDAALVRRLRRAGRATNPLLYRAERDPRRWAEIAAAQVNQVRKFARHHPGAARH